MNFKNFYLNKTTIYFGLCLAFSSWFAFFIAVLLHLPNPYWAAMPAWVIFQPSRGLLLERAIYRFVGTSIGAALGFAILLIPIHPLLQLLICGVLIGCATCCSHIFRGTIAYGFFTISLTMAIVLIPAVIFPVDSIHLAMSRVVCTFIGCIVITVVLALFIPKYPIRNFYHRIHLLSSDVIFCANEIMTATSKEECKDIEQTILANINDINDNAAIAAAGLINKSRKLRYIDAIIAASLDVMAASRALLTRNQRGNQLPEGLSQDLLLLSKQVSQNQVVMAELHTDFFNKWPLDSNELEPEIKRLLYTIKQLLLAEHSLLNNIDDQKSYLNKNYASTFLLPHRDWRTAINIAFVTVAIVFVMTTLCYIFKLKMADQIASGICIFAIVFGSFPLPQNNAPKLFIGACCGVIVAIIYRMTIQPYIDNHFLLLTTLIPFLILGGIGRANPKTAISAIDANMAFFFVGHIGLAATDSISILTIGIIYALSAGIISGLFILLPRKPDKQALNAILSIQRDLDRIIAVQEMSATNWYEQSTRQLLRLMLHLSRAGKLGDNAPNGLLSVLNIAYAITMLHAQLEQRELSQAAYIQIKTILYILTLSEKGNVAVIEQLSIQVANIDEPRTKRITEMLIDAINESTPFFDYINELKHKKN